MGSLNVDIDSEFDRDFTLRVYEENLKFIAKDYFRSKIVNPDVIPFEELGKRPVLFVGNHSGMTISWDNIIFDVCLFYEMQKHFMGDLKKTVDNKLIRLIDPKLSESRRLMLFGIKNWWKKTRCVPVTKDSFEKTMQKKGFVYLSPEGVPGISKGFNNRYVLQEYSTSFVRMAIKYNAIVIPVNIVNAEYLRPFSYTNRKLDKFMSKFGFPFIPLGEPFSQLIFPCMYLTPYPAKITYEFGKPVYFEGEYSSMSCDEFRKKTEIFRNNHQSSLEDSVEKYHEPFDIKSLFGKMVSPSNKKMFILFFWHEMFLKTQGYPWWSRQLYKIPLGFPLVNAFHRWFDEE